MEATASHVKQVAADASVLAGDCNSGTSSFSSTEPPALCLHMQRKNMYMHKVLYMVDIVKFNIISVLYPNVVGRIYLYSFI